MTGLMAALGDTSEAVSAADVEDFLVAFYSAVTPAVLRRVWPNVAFLPPAVGRGPGCSTAISRTFGIEKYRCITTGRQGE